MGHLVQNSVFLHQRSRQQPLTTMQRNVLDDDLTPNQLDPPKTRLRKAKEWLAQNPSEKTTTAARIFCVNRKTLDNAIHRKTNSSHGGQNRILNDAQEYAIHSYIRD